MLYYLFPWLGSHSSIENKCILLTYLIKNKKIEAVKKSQQFRSSPGINVMYDRSITPYTKNSARTKQPSPERQKPETGWEIAILSYQWFPNRVGETKEKSSQTLSCGGEIDDWETQNSSFWIELGEYACYWFSLSWREFITSQQFSSDIGKFILPSLLTNFATKLSEAPSAASQLVSSRKDDWRCMSSKSCNNKSFFTVFHM